MVTQALLTALPVLGPSGLALSCWELAIASGMLESLNLLIL